MMKNKYLWLGLYSIVMIYVIIKNYYTFSLLEIIVFVSIIPILLIRDLYVDYLEKKSKKMDTENK